MPGVFRIQTETMSRTSAFLANQADDLERELTDISRRWQDLVATWTGRAASAYEPAWDEWHDGAREVEAVTQTPTDGGAAGWYSIKGLSDGEHWLRFIRSGYKNVSIWIKVENAVVTQYRVSSQSSPTDLGAGKTLNVNMTK